MSKIRTTNMVLSFCSLLNKNQSAKQKTFTHNCVPYTGRLSRIGSYMLIFCLGVLLIFLSSCSTSTQSSSTTPSHIVGKSDSIEPHRSSLSPVPSTQDTSSVPHFIVDENDVTSPSQSQLTPISSVKPVQDVTHIPPTRPFPDFPPNYLQLPPQWLLNNFKDGNFTVTGGGIAINYQAWYEFTGRINKSKDAALTIQTFDLDFSKDILDKSRYQKAGRYLLSVVGRQAVWKYLSDDKNDITGKLSSTYDAETGLHEVFIGDKKVFEFIYFPYDPKQIALYFGHTPLEELPSAYSKEDAAKDGCLVIEQGLIQNINVLSKFTDSFEQYYDVGIFIRIFFEDDEGIKIMDIGSYNERACVTVDYTRHSKCDNMENTYVTTYYDNSGISIGGGDTPDLYELALTSDFRESIFIFKDMPLKRISRKIFLFLSCILFT